MIRVFLCEDNLTGILTGVYDAWDSRLGHQNVRLSTALDGDMELFCEYERVEPDIEKAGKVLKTVRRRLGEAAAEMIGYAAAYPHERKADAIYRMIVIGLRLPDGREVVRMLTQPDVELVFELRRKVWRLADHYMGFVRFRELKNGALLSEIDPDADLLALLAPHFADRLPLERWIIYDRRRRKAALHPGGRDWFLLEEVDGEGLKALQDSGAEARFQALWRTFHRTIGIEARTNGKLQKSMMPLKYRAFMTEFVREREDLHCEP